MDYFRFGRGEKTLVILPGLSVQSVMGSADAVADDQVLGADAAAQIAEKLDGRPDFELCMYDGYGYAAYDTAPDYKERILRFFAQDSSGNLTDTPAEGETLSSIRRTASFASVPPAITSPCPSWIRKAANTGALTRR